MASERTSDNSVLGSHTILSLRNAQNVSYHTFCLMSSGDNKHIRDNTICQCTVAQISLVTPECSARESCDNIGLFHWTLCLSRVCVYVCVRACVPEPERERFD